MKAKPECIVCLFKQALNTAKLVTEDSQQQLSILTELTKGLADVTLDQTPAALSQPAYETVARITGIADPYERQKEQTNRAALKQLPQLRSLVSKHADPLSAALHVAVAGNIIDMGIGHTFDIEQEAKTILDRSFAIDATENFRQDLKPGTQLLYLGDNAGEIVFDIVLVEWLVEAGVKVTYTVKSGPIINDATMTDAKTTGMDQLVPILETGASDIGVNFNNASQPFRTAFESADIILGKGHGNFETCNDRPENIYFLLKAKCEIVADELGVTLGDTVFTKVH